MNARLAMMRFRWPANQRRDTIGDMTPKVTDEIRQALQNQPGSPVRIEDDQTHQVYVIVDERTHEQAMQALREQQDDIAAIQAGIEDMEAGRFRPLEEVDAELRKKHNIPRTA